MAIISLAAVGLAQPKSWLATFEWAVAWLVLMLAYSPAADRLASRLVKTPPTLGVFRALQRSWVNLAAGILIAWMLGGFLEEFVFRWVVLRSTEQWLSGLLAAPLAVAIAVFCAAFGAGLLHLYQGLRATIIVTQLSILFGVLFVVSGYDLWTVILCHGFYDTFAFVRFAAKKSKYSNLDDGAA